jgi:hypothetical protein
MMGLFAKVSHRLRRDAGIGVEHTFLYRHEVSAAPLPAIESPAQLRIARIPADEIDVLTWIGPDERAEWDARLHRGDDCYGAWIGDAFVHYSWVQTQGTHDIACAGIAMPIHRGELWIYNCRTSEAHRGLKIYPRTLQYILRDRFASGALVAWIYVGEHNIASRRGIERAGFTRVRTLRALRLGRMYTPLVSQAAGWTGAVR